MTRFSLIPALCALAVLAALPAVAAAAEDPIARGEAVAREWDRRDLGFVNSKALLKMILENRHGETSERQMRMHILEVPAEDDGDRSLVIFDHPRDIRGTALLSYAHILEPDDQWLYLPALKRVKRISSRNKSGPFVGSEFAFEDFAAQELRKYGYTWLRDEACGALQCFVIEQRPLYEHSGYTRQVAWYDKAEYRQQRIDFYDRKNTLLKTLTPSDYRRYLDKHWRAHVMNMVNHQTGKKTRLMFERYEFKTDLRPGDFTRNTLKQVR
jgi:hypothetical protein